ncbi:MAG: coenzyme A pyrophosphatase [Deltaproteobacteria bacterium]|nr:MAG: coenzyme A pyrophosphatase [Deltaproteobacteria bacterium]
MPSNNTILRDIERIIKGRKSLKVREKGTFVHASVMIVLREENGEYFILLIRRPENTSDIFSGHMAFPGGKMKEEDRDKLDTAIRETFEETGIDIREKGVILGELDDFNPVNPEAKHYVVSPFVAFLTDRVEIRENKKEVAEVVWIPLSFLKEPGTLSIRTVERDGRRIKDYVFKYRGYTIWGITGRILFQFLSLVGHLFNK